MTKLNITAISKEEDEDKVFRLHDMLVQEVSLVDRAANQRKFLMLKREGDAMAKGEELKPDGAGGFTTDDAAAPEASTETAKSGEDASIAPITTQAKQDVLRMLAGALENLMSIATTVKAAEEGGEDDNLPANVVEGLKSVGGLLQGVAARYTAPIAASEDDAAAKSDDSEEAKAAEAPASEATPESVSDETVKSDDAAPVQEDEVLKALANAAAVLKPGPVDKAGRKMSKTRLDKLRDAMEALTTILMDVDPDALTEKGEVAKAAPAAKTSDSVEDAKVAELTKSVEQLTAAAKSSKAELAQLRKNVGLPNSLPVEGGGVTPTVEQSGSKDVTWPLDMNSPIDRESVGKANWFSTPNNK